MKEKIKHHISVALCFMKLAIQRQLEYPKFLIFWFVGIPIQYFAGVWMLVVITKKFQPLNGWSFPEITFLYGLSLLSHGMMVVLFVQTWHIPYNVIRGGFDRMLLRPMSVLFHFCVQNFNFIGLIDMIPGAVIFLYGCKISGFSWNFFNIIKLVLVLAGAVLIRASFYSLLGCTAFWTRSSNYLASMGEVILERTTMYPLSIYPYAFQIIFTFIMPLGFISFYPASDFLGKNCGLGLPLNVALLTPVVGIVMFIIAGCVFKAGLKKYESSGS